MAVASLPLGVIRGLDACALSSGQFVLLSIDVRQRLRADLNPSDPSAVTSGEMIEFKREVVDALGPGVSGSLLDPEMGAGHCVLTGTQPGQVGLVVALEETGHAGPANDRLSRQLEGWGVEKVKRMGASAAKVLLYYHPLAASIASQERFLESVSTECRRHELPLFVEVLVFSPETGGNLGGRARSDAIVETARRLSTVGGDIYMAQFPGDPASTDRAEWAADCAALDTACSTPWILLAGPADYETYEIQAGHACRAGASGVLAGKTVWGESLGLAPSDRSPFLASTGRDRLRRLTVVVEGCAVPWRRRFGDRLASGLSDGWYRAY